MITLSIFLIALAASLGAAPLFGRLVNRQPHNRRVTTLIGCAILVGYAGAGALAWRLTPPDWRLSFWETLAASVDAETYGHPTEHYAENILIVMLSACVAGAAIAGLGAATTASVLKRLRHARAATTA